MPQGESSMDGIERIRNVAPDRRRPLPQHVKHAMDYMRGNLGEKITLSTLASACSVPERTLLRQFERFAGNSPLAYLRRLRLNSARSELLRTDCRDKISDIAIRCGFSHLGWFAGDYHQLFRESPSATRQRVSRPCGQTWPRCGCTRARRIPQSLWRACHIGWRCAAAP